MQHKKYKKLTIKEWIMKTKAITIYLLRSVSFLLLFIPVTNLNVEKSEMMSSSEHKFPSAKLCSSCAFNDLEYLHFSTKSREKNSKKISI